MKFVLFGAGFWARYQLAAWGEQPDVKCLAVVDPNQEKAEALAATIGALAFTDPTTALAETQPDFVDIVTPVETHAPLARLCLEQRIPVICQKPLAPALEEAESLVQEFTQANTPLLIHENWRWQTPFRAAADLLKTGHIGMPFRARLTFSCSFPVFDNQPFLATLPRFILTDIGSHVLDTARFLFGEAKSVYALTQRVNPKIAGEDVATVLMPMGDSLTSVTVEMSYASRTEYERFPQTYLFVEGKQGSLEIGPDYTLRLTTPTGTHLTRVPPPRYPWADPAYDLVQASMVPCQSNLLSHLRHQSSAETTATDNLQTLRLIFAAYHSAQINQAISISP